MSAVTSIQRYCHHRKSRSYSNLCRAAPNPCSNIGEITIEREYICIIRLSFPLISFSICNYDEVDHVVAYIRQLIGGYVLPQYRGDQENTVKRKKMLPIGLESIGVIATYRAQCKVLRKRFTGEGWKNLKVGTVDSFQGEEKLIIVASTVRSKSQNAAFLNDSRVDFKEFERYSTTISIHPIQKEYIVTWFVFLALECPHHACQRTTGYCRRSIHVEECHMLEAIPALSAR